MQSVNVKTKKTFPPFKHVIIPSLWDTLIRALHNTHIHITSLFMKQKQHNAVSSHTHTYIYIYTYTYANNEENLQFSCFVCFLPVRQHSYVLFITYYITMIRKKKKTHKHTPTFNMHEPVIFCFPFLNKTHINPNAKQTKTKQKKQKTEEIFIANLSLTK